MIRKKLWRSVFAVSLSALLAAGAAGMACAEETEPQNAAEESEIQDGEEMSGANGDAAETSEISSAAEETSEATSAAGETPGAMVPLRRHLKQPAPLGRP